MSSAPEQPVGHTAGPWGVWNGTDVFTSSQEDEGYHVADCMVHDDSFSNLTEMAIAEKKANARLIAAAPDLLESLQKVVADQGWRGGPDDALLPADEQPFPIDEAMRAITKATS